MSPCEAGRAEGRAKGAVRRAGVRGVDHTEGHDPRLLSQDISGQTTQPARPQPAPVWVQPVWSVQFIIIYFKLLVIT